METATAAESTQTNSTAPVTQTAAPVTESWNGRMNFPKNRYVVRLMEKAFGLSKSSNNPMITMTWEIVGKVINGVLVTTSAIKQDDGNIKVVDISGMKCMNWLTLSEANMGRVRDFHRIMGLPLVDINPEAPDLSVYDSLVANYILSGDKYSELSDDIDEKTGLQIPIMDDDGKPIVKNRIVMGDLISRNTTLLG